MKVGLENEIGVRHGCRHHRRDFSFGQDMNLDVLLQWGLGCFHPSFGVYLSAFLIASYWAIFSAHLLSHHTLSLLPPTNTTSISAILTSAISISSLDLTRLKERTLKCKGENSSLKHSSTWEFVIWLERDESEPSIFPRHYKPLPRSSSSTSYSFLKNNNRISPRPFSSSCVKQQRQKPVKLNNSLVISSLKYSNLLLWGAIRNYFVLVKKRESF